MSGSTHYRIGYLRLEREGRMHRMIPLLLCAAACSSTAAPPVLMTVRLTLTSSVTVGPGATDLAWTTADPADVGGLWNATQPTRLTVPAGWAGRGLELYTGADVIGLTPATETVLLLIRKNGSMTLGVQQATASSDGFGDLALTVWDAHAAAGDFYTVRVICSDDSNDRQTVNAIPMTAFQVRTP